MSIDITMPALSPTMETGKLAKWVVSEGDSVAPGDIIAEIETDKATMEVEAVDEGVVAKILVAEGSENVAVNAVIAILAEEGEDVASVQPKAALPAAPTSAASAEPASTPVSEAPAASGDVNATPLAKKIAEQSNVDLSSVAGSGSRGKIMVEDVTAGNSNAVPVNSGAVSGERSGTRQFISPLARKLATDAGLDLTGLAQGTGPNGRIVASDVKLYIAAGGASLEKAASASSTSSASQKGASMAAGMSDEAVLRLYKEDEYEVKPHDGMRRIVAERLLESTQSIPSYTINMACRLDALLALRSEINAAAPMVGERGAEKPTYKISVNDLIVKALAVALQRVPLANASWTSDARILHKHSDVGVAVAVPDGLFTPIVRQAELKSLTQISSEIKDMAGRARAKKLQPQEYQGGSTAVSNLGMFGVDNFTSIINPPHASIVSIGAGEKKPVVINDEIKIATVMNATFAFDHRVIDGALGAELAGIFKILIEKPAGMLI